jgi:peptidoglycan/LPS O-acetylase OafA/YrhL
MKAVTNPQTPPDRAPAQAPAIRFAVLDSWRGLAAVMVVLFHAQIAGTIREMPLVRAGEMFVDFFFVLSGFVIAHGFASRIVGSGGLLGFMVMRFGRVYPLHLFVLLLFLAFETAKLMLPWLGNPTDPAFAGANTPTAFVQNLVLAQGVGLSGGLSWNTPSWSISAEFLVYGLFGAAALLARHWLWVPALAGAAASLAVLVTAAPLGMESTHDFGAVRALYGFSLGVLLHAIAIGGLVRRRAELAAAREPRAMRFAWTVTEVATLGAIGSCVTAAYHTPLAFAAPAVFAFAILVFAHEGGYVSRLLRLRPFLLVGALSYSIYMIHMLVILRVTNLARLSENLFGVSVLVPIGPGGSKGSMIDLGSPLLGDLLLLGVVAVTIAASWVTWRFVEEPGRLWFRRLASGMGTTRQAGDEHPGFDEIARPAA